MPRGLSGGYSQSGIRLLRKSGSRRLQMTVGYPGVTIGPAPRSTGAPLAGIHAQAAQAPIHGHAPVAGAAPIG